jgi:hypothetical protein
MVSVGLLKVFLEFADLVQDPQFYEARAIVLSNMGQHKQALEIHVYNMEDYDKAERYVL